MTLPAERDWTCSYRVTKIPEEHRVDVVHNPGTLYWDVTTYSGDWDGATDVPNNSTRLRQGVTVLYRDDLIPEWMRTGMHMLDASKSPHGIGEIPEFGSYFDNIYWFFSKTFGSGTPL